MKILNLYSGIGGNRDLWDNTHDITAVEYKSKIAEKYKNKYPKDKIIVADAHEYLLDHYKEFDFIWSSPPCPTHSKIRHSQRNRKNIRPVYPSMSLYEEIIFLDNYFNGKYVVENVIPYYVPLIPAKKRGRHLYWTNFVLPGNLGERKIDSKKFITGSTSYLSKFHDYDFTKYKGKQRRDKICRNLVDYEAGKTILEIAVGIVRKQNVKQTELF